MEEVEEILKEQEQILKHNPEEEKQMEHKLFTEAL